MKSPDRLRSGLFYFFWGKLNLLAFFPDSKSRSGKSTIDSELNELLAHDRTVFQSYVQHVRPGG